MAREELINSAVAFLRNPAVASATLEKRIEFLRSKNLTPNEIDTALYRAASDEPTPSVPSDSSPQPSSLSHPPAPPLPRYPPPAQYYQAPFDPYQSHAPAPPYRRDWRDTFVTATVATSISYTLYALFTRYLLPLLAPPTPAQLEQDKAAIDASFDRAFALLEKLTEDTETLKQSEAERTARLDKVLAELEDTIRKVKEGSKKRDDEVKKMEEVVSGLPSRIGEGIEGVERRVEEKLSELVGDVRGLGLLVNARMGNGNTANQQAPQAAAAITKPGFTGNKTNLNAGKASAGAREPSTLEVSGDKNEGQDRMMEPEQEKQEQSPSTTTSRPKKASIPAWQLAGAEEATS